MSRRAAGSSSRDREEAGAFLERIKQILKDDQAMPRKQRHTAKRIWERLGEDGFTGGYTVVKDAVRELTQKNREVFVPLLHRPGEAQVDFGHALANVNGQLRKVAFFVMALPYGDAVLWPATWLDSTVVCSNAARMIKPAGCVVRRASKRSCCWTIKKPFCHCRPHLSKPAASFQRRPVCCRWCALTTTTIHPTGGDCVTCVGRGH